MISGALIPLFSVHDMNAEMLLQIFLPYHSSPNFPRILAILTLPPTSPWHAPFISLIKSPQAIPRSYITAAISPEREKSLRLFGQVAGMLKEALTEGIVHRALLGFWTGLMVDSLEKIKNGQINEGMVKMLVESFVDILITPGAGQDVNVGPTPHDLT
jgi:U3 small nucleolar RNA-associated protein 10